MSPRLGGPTWFILAGMLTLLGAGAMALWSGPRPVPSLDEICALARQHHFDQAEVLMTRYLRANPNDNRAHLLMAQFALDQPDPHPQHALNQLGQIQPSTPKVGALVKFCEGRAHYQQKRYDRSEICWKEALILDPVVPEAGWAMLDLLDLEGRMEEVHRLGMKLYEVEPDPRDRIRLLLEMIRLDVEKVAPGSVVQVFEPVWKEHPDYLPLALLLGSALVHNSQADEGIDVLRDGLNRYPDSVEAWDGWLDGLDNGHRPDLLQQEFSRLPKAFAADQRFAKHEGSVAQAMGNWTKAAAAYRRAYEFEPFNGVILYRLRMALRALDSQPNLIESTGYS